MKTVRVWDYVVTNKDWEVNITYIWKRTKRTVPKIQVWNRILTDKELKELED